MKQGIELSPHDISQTESVAREFAAQILVEARGDEESLLFGEHGEIPDGDYVWLKRHGVNVGSDADRIYCAAFNAEMIRLGSR